MGKYNYFFVDFCFWKSALNLKWAQIQWHIRISGYVNTNYLFSMTEEDADEEQQKLYRLKQTQTFNNGDFLTLNQMISGYTEGLVGWQTQIQ